MYRRIACVFVLLVALTTASTAAANAVLLEGSQGDVVPTASQEIHTLVEAQVATTEVTTTFTQLSSDAALFCFGVPEQAAAYELVLIVDGVEQVADVAVGDEASYPQGMGSNDAQDLAEYLGENPMRTWVSDIPAGAEVAFRLSYVELLPYEFGEVTFTFPLLPFDGDTDRIDRLVFELELSTERTIEAFGTSLAGAAVTTHSATHQSVTVTLEDTYRNADASVTYRVAQTDLGMNLWAYRPEANPWVEENDGYFLLLLEPPTESEEVSDKVFTYVLDRSGSMSGSKMVDARNAAISAVQGLNDGDYFNILAFDDRLVFLANGPLLATEPNRHMAIAFLETIGAAGSTAIHAALLAALDAENGSSNGQVGGGLGSIPREEESFAEPSGCLGGGSEPAGDDDDVSSAFEDLFDEDQPTGNDDDAPIGGMPRVMLFLTDGLPTAGITSPSRILDDVDAANGNDTAIYSVAIGDDADESFLDALATQNRGASVQIGANDDLQTQLEELFLRINNPLLVRPDLDLIGGATYDVLPEELPDLFIGNQLVIVGRYSEPGTFGVELSGEIDGEPALFDYGDELPEVDDANSFVGRIWAVTMVQHLLARITAEGELPELVDRVTELGLDYGINTPYTPFSFESGDDDDYGDDDDAAWTGDDDDIAYADSAEDQAAGCSCSQRGITQLDPALLPMAILGILMLLRGYGRRR